MRRAAIVALLTLPVLFLWAPAAQAHANLDSSEPADGAILATAPERVTLTFTSRPARLRMPLPSVSAVRSWAASPSRVQGRNW